MSKVGVGVGLQGRIVLGQREEDDASWFWVSGREEPVWGEVGNVFSLLIRRVFICEDSQRLYSAD